MGVHINQHKHVFVVFHGCGMNIVDHDCTICQTWALGGRQPNKDMFKLYVKNVQNEINMFSNIYVGASQTSSSTNTDIISVIQKSFS